MSNPQMVVEVNRLMSGLLLSEGGVYLPSVGSLRVERCAAKRLSKRSVLPPHRIVSFSSQQAGLSLVEAIARAIRIADGDDAQARAVYDRWLGYVLQNETVTIEGVGVLAQKYFTLDPDFDKRLNPQGREPVKLNPARRSDWAIWVGSIAILVTAGFGGYEYLMMVPDPQEVAVAVEKPAMPIIPEPVAPVVSEVPTGTTEESAIQAPAEPVEVKPAEPVVVSKSALPGEMTPGRRYVVLGVFSTPENAERAVAKAEADYAGVRCSVYRFGEKWMVSCFESDDAAACAQFIGENRSRMADLWTYTAK